jgi:hypothetical protein
MLTEFKVWTLEQQMGKLWVLSPSATLCIGLRDENVRTWDHAWKKDKCYEVIIKLTCNLAPSDMPT